MLFGKKDERLRIASILETKKIQTKDPVTDTVFIDSKLNFDTHESNH